MSTTASDCPDHPVRARPEFQFAKQVDRKPPRFGVKLQNLVWQLRRVPTWHYAPTMADALDTALAYLVAQTIQGKLK